MPAVRRSQHTLRALARPPHRAGLMPSSMLELPPGRYTTEPDLASVDATSRAASMRRSSIMPGPAERVASEISRALSDSPSARMTAALRSCAFQACVSPEGRSRVHDTPEPLTVTPGTRQA